MNHERYARHANCCCRFPFTRARKQDIGFHASGPSKQGDQRNPTLKRSFAQVQAGLAKMLPGVAPAPLKSTVRRDLTLNEDLDEYGRLIQRMGTTQQLYSGTYARNYMDPTTEIVKAGSTEVWRMYNLTGDTHPIHFHLVNVQIIGRAQFDAATPTFAPTTAFAPPDLNESGWKETVRINPGEVMDVIAKFDPPSVPKVPASPATGGNEYVYHCHILEHEEHDVMRHFQPQQFSARG